ncbi:MAG: lamin tail domain-containing protein [Chloroflexi bacterium]|nr:lamin tail domain-containing protein [Chloroflexota bacterium]
MIQKQRAKRRLNYLPPIIFLALIFATAVSGTYIALRLFGDNAEAETVPEIITVEIIITATPAPAQAATALPAGSSDQVDLPADIAGAGSESVATVDAARLGAVDAALSTPTVEAGGEFLSDNCKFYTVQGGDTPFGIAERWGANPYLLLEVNNLTLETATNLQIGDRLIVPLPGCNVEGQIIETGGTTSTANSAASAIATSTPAPVPIEIASVEGIGDITAEGIRLRNTGGEINISGWTLDDADGNTYTFPGLLLFTDAVIAIYTRSGASTEGALFWGSDQAVWQAGEQVTLKDRYGQVRKTLQIPTDESN